MCDTACDSCVSCNTAYGANTCNASETFCGAGTHKAKRHGNGQLASATIGASTFPSVAKDDIIIKKTPIAVWNAAVAWVIKAKAIGNQHPSDGSEPGPFTREHLYAAELAKLVSSIESIDSNSVGFTPAKDDVVKASDILKIYAALQAFKVGPEACDVCDSSCDVKCDSCDDCVSSECDP